MGQDSPLIKPAMWGIDPGVIAYNCWKHGFPVPVLAMPFWEGAGDRAYDVSGKMNHGTLTAGAKWTGERSGGVISFDGVDDYINVADKDIFAFTNQITLSARVNLKSGDSNNAVILARDNTAGNYWNFFLRKLFNNQLQFLTPAGIAASNGTIQFDRWYHVVGRYDGSEVSMYVDGNKQSATGTGTSDIGHPLKPITIGKSNYASTDSWWKGFIDLPRIYNCALTPEQIKFEYDNPYFMFQPIPVPYGYAAPVGGLSIPVAIHHYQHNIRV